MSPRPTLGRAVVDVLAAVAGGYRYGFDIIDATGLPSGTVYPALARLEDERAVESRWEDHRIAQREKRPPRRYYAITPTGERALQTALKEHRALARSARPRSTPRLARSRG